jgi:hypothetical protein
MGKTLVVHLGLPKTGTSTLQTHLFPFLPGYVGRSAGPTQPALFSQIHGIWSSYLYGDRDASRVADDLTGWVQSLPFEEFDTLLLSSEWFCRWPPSPFSVRDWPTADTRWSRPRKGQFPVVPFLAALKDSLPDGMELRTILTVRNQVDFLGSLAAEAGVSNMRFVRRLIRRSDRFVDFYSFTTDLENVVGRQSHLTTVFEDGIVRNSELMLSFMGLDRKLLSSAQLGSQHENLRKLATGSWAVNSQHDIFRQIIKRSVLKAPPQFFRSIKKPVLFVLRLFERGRGMLRLTVSISKNEKDQILEYCNESNEKLAQHLGRNLRPLGY